MSLEYENSLTGNALWREIPKHEKRQNNHEARLEFHNYREPYIQDGWEERYDNTLL